MIESRQFRQALGQFATGVTIVTTRDGEGRPIGVTASSFNAVSLEPPLVLWSIGRNAFSYPAFADAGGPAHVGEQQRDRDLRAGEAVVSELTDALDAQGRVGREPGIPEMLQDGPTRSAEGSGAELAAGRGRQPPHRPPDAAEAGVLPGQDRSHLRFEHRFRHAPTVRRCD